MVDTLPISVAVTEADSTPLGERIIAALGTRLPSWISQIEPSHDQSDRHGVLLEVILQGGRRLNVMVKHTVRETRNFLKKAIAHSAGSTERLTVPVRAKHPGTIRAELLSKIYAFAKSLRLIGNPQVPTASHTYEAPEDEVPPHRPRRHKGYINRPPRAMRRF